MIIIKHEPKIKLSKKKQMLIIERIKELLQDDRCEYTDWYYENNITALDDIGRKDKVKLPLVLYAEYVEEDYGRHSSK